LPNWAERRYLADIALGNVRGHRFIEENTQRPLEHLREMNSERVQSDLVNRVQESRAQFGSEMRKTLLEMVRVAEQALERARAAKTAGSEAALAEIDRLEKIERELQAWIDSRNANNAGQAFRE